MDVVVKGIQTSVVKGIQTSTKAQKCLLWLLKKIVNVLVY